MYAQPTRTIPFLALVAALALGLCWAPPLSAAPDAAEKALEAGEFEKAAKLYGQALEKNPTDLDAATGLAKAAAKAGLDDQLLIARDALFEHLDKNDKNLDVRLALGEIAIARGKLTSDPQEMKWIYPDAEGHFQAALKLAPNNPRAIVGLAHAFYYQAKYADALKTLETWLAKEPKEGAAEGLFLQGEIHYMDARDLHAQAGNGYPLPQNVATAYRKAQGSYMGSVKADPSNAEAQMRLAYVSSPLGDLPAAEAAYLAVAELDPDNGRAIRGLYALYGRNNRTKYDALLKAIIEKDGSHPAATLAVGADLIRKKDYDAAEKLLAAGAKKAKFPATHHYYRGEAAFGAGNKDKARSHFMKALEIDPGNALAAAGAQKVILDGRSLQDLATRMSPADAAALVKEFDRVLKVTPKNVDLRNNLAFILRECYVAHNHAAKYKSVLMASIKAYEDACEIIGEWDNTYLDTMSFQQRYGYAQVISDTGLMFQFYEATRDYDKAAMYYERALRFSDYGYFDAWNNYRVVLAEQKKWDELYDLASACGDGLIQSDGKPHETGRAQARAVAQGLIDSNKVK